MNANTAHRLPPNTPTATVRMPLVRDAFRLHWMTRGRPQLEAYLFDTAEPERSMLLRLLLDVDSEFRIAQACAPIAGGIRQSIS